MKWSQDKLWILTLMFNCEIGWNPMKMYMNHGSSGHNGCEKY